MSVEAITWAMKQRVGNGTAKLLLIALANHADHEGICWPSQASLAAVCEVSVRSVREYLLRLEMVGLIAREERRRGDGTRASDLIRLCIDMAAMQAAIPAASAEKPRRNNQAANPAAGLSSGKIRHHQAADSAGPVRDKPLLEPIISEPSLSKARERAPVPDGFQEIWISWPRRDRSSKPKTQTIWRDACRRHGAAPVAGAIAAYLASPDAAKEAGAYVPAMERWLRDKLDAWLEIAAAAPPPDYDPDAERRAIIDRVLGKVSNG